MGVFYPNGEFGFQRRDSESGKSEGAKPFPRLPLNPFAVHLRWLLEAVLTSLLSGGPFLFSRMVGIGVC